MTNSHEEFSMWYNFRNVQYKFTEVARIFAEKVAKEHDLR